MTARTFDIFRAALLWFCAGAGFDIQGRILDHALDGFIARHHWLAWLS